MLINERYPNDTLRQKQEELGVLYLRQPICKKAPMISPELFVANMKAVGGKCPYPQDTEIFRR